MMTETVVVNAGLGVGHLAPMVELANLFPRHGLAVTVVLIEPPAKPPSFAAAVSRSMASNPRITFHVMPSPSCHSNVPELIRAMNAPLREYLRSSVPAARAVVFDMFCACARDVAAELGLPAYFFQCGGASHLAVGLHLPHVQAEINASFGEIGDEPLLFPSVPPFKPSDLPKAALDRNDEMYRWILGVFERLPESRGILVNTFQWLETKALRALGDGACVVGRPHAAGVLRRATGLAKRGGQEARVPLMAGRAAGEERRVPLLREHGLVPQGAARGDRHWAGEVRTEVPVGGAASARRRGFALRFARRVSRHARRAGHRRAHAGGVLGEDQGQGARRRVVGAAGGRAAAQGDRRVRDALRVELGAGGDRRRRATAVLAALRGAEDEQGVHRGGGRGRRCDGGVRRRGGQSRGGGGEG